MEDTGLFDSDDFLCRMDDVCSLSYTTSILGRTSYDDLTGVLMLQLDNMDKSLVPLSADDILPSMASDTTVDGCTVLETLLPESCYFPLGDTFTLEDRWPI